MLKFDIFLSHNNNDKPVVELIAEKLRNVGISVWFDKWQLKPGGFWQEDLALGMQSSVACAVFIGLNGLGDWSREELAVALNRAAKDRAFQLFLVLLPGLSEPFDATTLPPFLCTRTWVDMRHNFDHEETFLKLVSAINVNLPCVNTHIESSARTCPYRGLQFFDEDHSEFFWGRESEIQRLLEKLKTNRFISVVGPSGSGKSSLIRAGLIPALRNNALPDSETWKICVFTPGSHPLMTLSAYLLRIFPLGAMQDTLDRLNSDVRTLHLAVTLAYAERPTTECVVWVIDQLEELFTLCNDEVEKSQFLLNILYASSIPDGRNIIVLTLRADFYHKFAIYPELSACISIQQFIVSPVINTNGLKNIIENPARTVGLHFEEGLVETIIGEVSSQTCALPLLEHTLLELWKLRRGETLTLEDYRNTGGVSGAVANRAESIYVNLTPKQKIAMKQILLRVTHPGEGTEDTRRRASITEFYNGLNGKEKYETVLNAMVESRLLVICTDDLTIEPYVDVAHEALIRAWPRLTQWIDENRSDLLTHLHLIEAANEWKRLDYDASALYRGIKLAEVLEWRADNQDTINELEEKFVSSSKRIDDRNNKLQYLMYSIPFLLVFIFTISISLVTAINDRLDTYMKFTEADKRVKESENKVKLYLIDKVKAEREAMDTQYYKRKAEILQKEHDKRMKKPTALD